MLCPDLQGVSQRSDEGFEEDVVDIQTKGKYNKCGTTTYQYELRSNSDEKLRYMIKQENG